jgi:DNA polymerase
MCRLCAARTTIVVDRGNPKAKLMLVGEGPGEQEDIEGRAFVGRSGRLLDRLLSEAGIDPSSDVFIANVVKCRPPENRAPKPDEAQTCIPFLHRQIELVRPSVIGLLGATAARYLLEEKLGSMKKELGRTVLVPRFGFATFVVLYHPAYLLYNAAATPEMTRVLSKLAQIPGAKR